MKNLVYAKRAGKNIYSLSLSLTRQRPSELSWRFMRMERRIYKRKKRQIETIVAKEPSLLYNIKEKET